MVESVDDLKTSQSIGGHRFSNLEMLDAKIASGLKMIMLEPLFQEKSQSGGAKEYNDRSLRGRQIAFMIYEYCRVNGAHEAVLDYSHLFRVTLHGDDVQEL